MTDNASGASAESMSACSRFFSIVELVSLFLHQTETPALVMCQRVCRGWQEIIQKSQELQEHLYLKPSSRIATEEERVRVTLNPTMSTHFARIWGQHETISLPHHQYAAQAAKRNYLDLTALPWARDGTHASARARLAFAREEASWRKMLVSQPPIRWLDWWHAWESSDRRSDERHPNIRMRRGEGHQQSNADLITMGALWDSLEGRLLRGCTVQVTFFPAGGSAEDDPSAAEYEKECRRPGGVSARGFSTALPRIRIHSRQVWPNEGPSIFQIFNVPEGVWEIHDELSFTPGTDRERRRWEVFDGDGTHWLTVDCRRDTKEANWRLSRSNACEGLSLCRIASRMSGGNSQLTRRRRERLGMPL